MERPGLELGEIVRRYGDAFRNVEGRRLSYEQQRVLHALEICRTAALGGHVEQCDQCGHQVIAYNSCRNRHCPKCQSLAKALWLARRRAELLPVDYYHVVFTLPHALSDLALQNKRLLYNLLFQAASQALLALAADPKYLGARIGFLAILHTWGQNLLLHPHLHCIVPGGGLSADGARWVSCRPGFFLPVRLLSERFRQLFLAGLEALHQQGKLVLAGQLQPLTDPLEFDQLVETCRAKDWVVYAKPPFGGPEQVLDYLARYTHRVAISNHRLLSLDHGQVSFTWKDYRHAGRRGTLTLDANEFLRRFLLHVVPNGFVRIRSFGLFANARRAKNLALCRERLGVEAIPPNTPLPEDPLELLQQLTDADPCRCPVCKTGRLVLVETMPRPPLCQRPPPSRMVA